MGLFALGLGFQEVFACGSQFTFGLAALLVGSGKGGFCIRAGFISRGILFFCFGQRTQRLFFLAFGFCRQFRNGLVF